MFHPKWSTSLARAAHCLVMVQHLMASLDTGRLVHSNQASSSAAVIPLRSPSLLAGKVRHWPKEHSSPLSSAELELSPSLKTMNLLPVLLGACFPWWGQICELGHDMTQCSAGSKWSSLTPLEPRCLGLFCSALSLVTWNMRCSQECPVLFLLHFVLILAAGHEELSDPGSLLSLFAEQGQCFAVLLETELLSACPNWMHDWKRLCS